MPSTLTKRQRELLAIIVRDGRTNNVWPTSAGYGFNNRTYYALRNAGLIHASTRGGSAFRSHYAWEPTDEGRDWEQTHPFQADFRESES